MQLLTDASAWSLPLAIAVGVSATLSSQDISSGLPPISVLSRSAPETVQVLKNGATVDVRKQILKVVLRSGDREKFANVVMLLDPESGLHWWFYQFAHKSTDNFKEFVSPFVVYLTDHEAIGFAFSSTLVVREVIGRHRNFEAIEKVVLADLGGKTKSLIMGDPPPYIVKVNVRSELGDFLVKRNSAAMPPSPRIVGLSRDGDLWRITLKGPNGDFAEVVLDSHYDVKSVSRMPTR